ncbi:thiol reductant ABC exporter subunit CydD [Bordetella petrii]|uniref:thiol reductant ABC exporter subunit CydD n=1 Tax=Bordetella petrii TaxID=94624 RepID=UPI0004921F8A|nr:thiol reductant ABC exporter subunit CydD [Bordetella petrii]
MSGIAGLERDPAASRPSSPEHARWLAAQARTVRGPLGLAAAAPLAGGVLLLLQAWWLARLLDAAIAGQAPRAELAGAIGVIAGLMLARAGLAWLAERASARAAERIKQSVRLALFERLLAQGPAWSRTRVSGELASAVVDQVDVLDGFFSRYLPAVIAAAVLPPAFAVALLPFDLVAGVLLLVTAPLIPLFMALVGWGAEAASRRHLRAFARLSGFFADRLRGLVTLKLYGRAEAEGQAVAAASEALRRRTMAVLRIAFLSSAVLEFFAALGVAGIAVYFGLTYLGFLDLRATPLTLQTGFFCLLMAPEVYAPLRQFAAHYHDRAAARAAVAQIAQVFDGLPEAAAPRQPSQALVPAGSGAAALQASGLTVPAAGRPVPVLDAARLDLPAGAHMALMGASGAGKTTLLEALCRLRPCAGEIRIDGRPLADWDEAALRARVALIGQRPYLFAGSIAANIRLGRPDATDEQVCEAARRAHVLAFTQAMPAGLQTQLGEGGHGLSGGQMQRVALARLFLRDPGLILLDEPTAHLDDVTQAQVLDEILSFARGRTLLLATHAPAVAARLPRVVRLARGTLEPA